MQNFAQEDLTYKTQIKEHPDQRLPLKLWHDYINLVKLISTIPATVVALIVVIVCNHLDDFLLNKNVKLCTRRFDL